MDTLNAVVLCTYSYDPLDRLAAASPAGSDSVQRFYQKSRLTTEIQGEIRRAVFQSEDYLLARQQLQSGQTGCALLGTDQQRSVLHGLNPTQQQAFAYSPFGFRPPQLDLPGFNGEQPDALTGHYLLGNGYRAFNPVLMSFNSPDSLSPFGDGGLNAYAYCGGDPVNRVDPTGHTNFLVKFFLRRAGFMSRSSAGPIAGGARGLLTEVQPQAARLPLSVSPAVTETPLNRLPYAPPSESLYKPLYRLMHGPVSPEDARIAYMQRTYNQFDQLASAEHQSSFLALKISKLNKTRGRVIVGPRAKLKIVDPKLRNYLRSQAELTREISMLREDLGYAKTGNEGLPSYYDAVKNLRAGN